MKSNLFCPISNKRLDEHVVRSNATITLLILLAFLLTNLLWLAILVAIDFFIRAIPLPRYSPLAIASKAIVSSLGLKVKPINAGPKIFAARIGFVLSTLAVITFLLSYGSATVAITTVLAFFCFLEGAFGICVACNIYPLLYRYLYRDSHTE